MRVIHKHMLGRTHGEITPIPVGGPGFKILSVAEQKGWPVAWAEFDNRVTNLAEDVTVTGTSLEYSDVHVMCCWTGQPFGIYDTPETRWKFIGSVEVRNLVCHYYAALPRKDARD